MAETHCKKYLPVTDPSRCPIDHGEEREICQAEVFVPQGSRTDKQITKLYCDEQSDYYTRKIRGTDSSHSTRYCTWIVIPFIIVIIINFNFIIYHFYYYYLYTSVFF